jgi:uncharacterized membrane protein YfcA
VTPSALALERALLFFAAMLGGALNSVAGGGSFISFPALLFTGVAPVVANATNTIALWPAGVAGAFTYRNDLRSPRRVLLALGAASLVGGTAGSLLLLRTRESTFVHLIPFLLLAATLLFTFGNVVTRKLRSRGRATASAPSSATDAAPIALASGVILQLVISVYGGYFGGGMGIMMLATLSVMGMTDIHAMNGLKTLLGTLINGASVVAFIIAGAVDWGPGIVMIAGGTLGGWGGASLAKRIDPAGVKRFVMVVAWSMTAYFFFDAFVRRR